MILLLETPKALALQTCATVPAPPLCFCLPRWYLGLVSFEILNVTFFLLSPIDWHQYDDIICMKPPGTFQKFQNLFTNKMKKELVKEKKLAAAIMLGRIFSNLQTWNLVNLQNFFTQFRQFYYVVQEPMIYEGKAQPWYSLGLGEEEVSDFPRLPAALVWVGRVP